MWKCFLPLLALAALLASSPAVHAQGEPSDEPSAAESTRDAASDSVPSRTDGAATTEAPPASEGAQSTVDSPEETTETTPTAVTEVRPPELVDAVEIDTPAEVAGIAAGTEVILELTIDALGLVTESSVDQTSGIPALDAHAQEAASGYLFQPATRGGQAIASRILYRYVFEPPASEQHVGHVQGTVFLFNVHGEANEPIPNATVTLTDRDGLTHETTADVDGTFSFADIPEGPAEVAASKPTMFENYSDVQVVAGETVTVTIELAGDFEDEALAVLVEGQSEGEELRESAAAVDVIETEQAQRETADLGEVLARTKGVGVRRGGGLGSTSRFSLNGLTDDQIRFFLDGIPLDLAGFPFGLANVPVNLVDRVDIYRGVVPIRFGADALGGAVDLVTDDIEVGLHGSASYQVGSFGTHRATLDLSYKDEVTGLFTRVGGFFDIAENDYPVDVEVADSRGRLSPATAYRFNDAYRATGANLEFGIEDQDWTDRLRLRVFATDYYKELQNNAIMSIPYGGVNYGEFVAGALVDYEMAWENNLSVDLVAGYTYGFGHYEDVSDCVYDWFGQCVRERTNPGEVEGIAHDIVQTEHSVYGRLNAAWEPTEHHALRLSLSPSWFTRTGDEREELIEGQRDPLNNDRTLLNLVTGLEYELNVIDERLQNVAFAKHYLQFARSDERLPGGAFVDRDRDTARFGAGNALRYRFLDWLYAKVSYEFATRLPRPDEVFGDGFTVVANLQLKPETSHNLNLGVTIDAQNTLAGDWRLDVNGFLRETDQLIVLLGNDQVFSYQNVYGARSVGVEASGGWTSPGDFVAIDLNTTYVDLRNTAEDGTFGDFAGDRIPNRPYLFANANLRLQFSNVIVPLDLVTISWTTRYVHEFFRSWESIGRRDLKQTVDSQVVHSLAGTYVVDGERADLSLTAELQNITDADAFDFFGVQRPGRAFYFKATTQF